MYLGLLVMRAAEVDTETWAGHVRGTRTWRVEGADTSMRTLVRHALFADVAVQAVDRVTFHAWSGLVESSLVAHRMGQLAVRGLEPLSFELKFSAPADAPLTWVTTEHITGDGGRVVRGGGDRLNTEEPLLLIPLLAGQRVHLTCTTSLGSGRRKATWNSVFPIVRVVGEEEVAAAAGGKAAVLSPQPFTVTVETTGACTPVEAMTRALTTSIATLKQIVSRR